MGLSAAEWFAVRLSLQVSLAAVVLALPLAVALSLLLIRRPFRGRVLLEAVIMAPLVVPPVVTGYLLLLAVGPHTVPGTIFRRIFGGDLAFAPAGAVLAAAVVSFPLVFRPVRAALEGVDPTYVNVSRSLGVGRVRTFLRVVLPMAWPGMLTGAVLGFARSLGEFGATIMVAGNIPFRTTTVPLAIYGAFHRPDGDTVALRLVLVSLAVSLAALAASEWLARRRPRA